MPGTLLDDTIRYDAMRMVGARHLPPQFLSSVLDQLYSDVNITDAAVALDRARAAGDGSELIAQRLYKGVMAGVMLQNQRETGSRDITGQTTALQNMLDGITARALPAAPVASPVEAASMSAETAAFAGRLNNIAAIADRMAAAAAAGR